MESMGSLGPSRAVHRAAAPLEHEPSSRDSEPWAPHASTRASGTIPWAQWVRTMDATTDSEVYDLMLCARYAAGAELLEKRD